MEDRNSGDQEQRGVREGIYASSRIESFVMVAAIAIASIGLGYLYFTQLWWKAPPDFNCNTNEQGEFVFAREGPDGELVTASGLCNWIGIEAFYSDKPRNLFTAGIPAPVRRPGNIRPHRTGPGGERLVYRERGEA